MAACLNPDCTSTRAKVIHSRVARLERVDVKTGRRYWIKECYQVTECPPAPEGCGQVRRRTVHDEGQSATRYVKALSI